MNTIFQNENEISEEWLNYLEAEALSLSESSIAEIEQYMDREALNPEMTSYLKSSEVSLLFDSINANEQDELSLGGYSVKSAVVQPSFLNFKKLKRKIRKVFCEIGRELEGLPWKEIIEKVLLALIPAFAVSGGLSAAVFPIVVALVVIFGKRGYDALCPV